MNHLLMGCQMKLWTIHVQMRVLEAIGSDIPNFIKDVPRVPKCVSRWGSTTDHFLVGFQMKFFTIVNKMGVPKSVGMNVPKFVKDVPRVPKCVLR